jgi:hypothetical protein
MTGRDTGQQHRAATPLELFFDLCFVVAVARAAEGLHHGVADDHVPDALLGYGTVFFAIWWAWGNFTGSPRPTTPTTRRTASPRWSRSSECWCCPPASRTSSRRAT